MINQSWTRKQLNKRMETENMTFQSKVTVNYANKDKKAGGGKAEFQRCLKENLYLRIFVFWKMISE